MGLKHSVNEEFFDTWSPEMAYVLGYLFADGNIINYPHTRAKYVRFFSTDKDRIELVKDLMRSKHRIHARKRDASRKIGYSIQIGSHTLFDATTRHGLTPNKSLTVLFPHVPDECLPAFVLGYFDGDGCAFIERSKNGNAKKLHCIFTSGSEIFLKVLHAKLVLHTGIIGKGLCRHGSNEHAFQLRYATRDSMRVFLFIYSSNLLRELALERKYGIFMKYFDERDLSPVDLPQILTKKGPVVK